MRNRQRWLSVAAMTAVLAWLGLAWLLAELEYRQWAAAVVLVPLFGVAYALAWFMAPPEGE